MSDIKPLAAECRIGYGDKKVALKGDLFTPSTEKDREDLLALGAARELNDVEQELFDQISKAPADGGKKSAKKTTMADADAGSGDGADADGAETSGDLLG